MPLWKTLLITFLKWFLQAFSYHFVLQFFLGGAERLSLVRNYHRTYAEHRQSFTESASSHSSSQSIIFFTCVRHPLDRLYSLYSYGFSTKPFGEFVDDIVGGMYDEAASKNVKTNPKETQCSYLEAATGPIVRRTKYEKQKPTRINKIRSFSTDVNSAPIIILRFESIDADWKKFALDHNLRVKKLPVRNASKNRKTRDWREAYKLLDTGKVKALEDIFASDFARFGYDRFGPVAQ